MSKQFRVGFVGATSSTRLLMQEILRQGHTIPVLYTLQGPALFKKNRSVDLAPFCKEHGIDLVPIHEYEHIKDSRFIQDIQKRDLDLLVESGFSQLLPAALFNAPRHGTIGLHYALLPAYKGPASLNWALLLDKHEWGISMFTLAEGFDQGGTIGQGSFPVTSEDDANTLFDKADATAVKLLAQYVPTILAGKMKHITPLGEDSHTRRFTPEEYQISWHNSARQNHNIIRAFTWPFPGAYSKLGDNVLFYWRSVENKERTKAAPGTVLASTHDHLRVACGDGHSLDITSLSLISAELVAEREQATKVVGNILQHEQPVPVSPPSVLQPGDVLFSSKAAYPRL